MSHFSSDAAKSKHLFIEILPQLRKLEHVKIVKKAGQGGMALLTRCHLFTVSGFTMTRTSRHRGQILGSVCQTAVSTECFPTCQCRDNTAFDSPQTLVGHVSPHSGVRW